MEFINPPNADSEDDNPVYRLNSIVTVRWTEPEEDKATSLTLWQLNATSGEYFGDMEYITNNVVDRSNFRWIVATTKDLAISNFFFLSIFEEGKAASDANTLPFNITTTQEDDKDEGETETSTLKTSTTASTSTSTSASATVSTTGSSADSDRTESEESSGLSTSGKIGIGVAVPLVFLLAVAGFFLFRWQRKRRGGSQPAALQQQPYNTQDPGYKTNTEPYYWQPHPAQAGHGQWGHTELPGSETRGTTGVYELDTSQQQQQQRH